MFLPYNNRVNIRIKSKKNMATDLKVKQKINSPIDTKDNVNHPSHYTWLKAICGIEVIDIVENMDFLEGNIVKYLLRAGKKEELGYSKKQKKLEDLEKAQFYLNRLIENLKKQL